jgi:hypothetical protein
MRFNAPLGVIVSVAGLIAAAPLLACGDKLAALGGGVRIERIPRSDHPGSVVVVASPALASARAGAEGLVASLRKAGHDARLVSSPGELEAAAPAGVPDIVLADVATARMLRESAGGRLGSSTIVPLLYRPTPGDLEAARQSSSCVAPIADWGIAPVLRVIDRIRAQQSDGQPVSCGSGPSSRA